VQLVANVHPVAGDHTEANAVAQAEQAEQAFTLALLRQTNASGGNGNAVLSPSSLAIALSMLQNGAVGTTRDGIAKVLQTQGLTSEQQSAGWAALMSGLAQASSTAGVTLESANSLWLQRNLPM
jgi:serpin B